MAKIDLKNKVVLIAGGAKNLGGLISREVAKQGADVVVHYNSDSTKAAAEETVKAIENTGRKAIVLQGDLTKAKNVKSLFETAKSQLGRIDVAINTVGMVLKKPLAETTEEEFDTMSAVNSKSAYFFLKEAGKHLEDNGKAMTIATSLLGAYTGLYSTYAGGKAPVEHYTSSIQRIW